MGELEDILGAVEGLHGASTAPEQWPVALDKVRALLGGVGVTLELFDRATLKHRFLEGMSLPENQPARMADYPSYYQRFNVRAQDLARQLAGTIRFDRQYMTESAMDRNPFYGELLASGNMRYCVSGALYTGPDLLGSLAVQFSRAQTETGTREARRLRPLLRHATMAIDVALRLRHAAEQAGLGEALDWLADGIVLIADKGRVLSNNAAAASIASRGDGLDLAGGWLSFGDAQARRALALALRDIAEGEADPRTGSGGDFVARRAADDVPYTIAVRSLRDRRAVDAVAVVFIHDPLASNTSIATLQLAFGLTPAEAHLAAALRRGPPPGAYARANGLSINTIYTHLAHIKDKCGRSRAGELIGVLNAVANRIAPTAQPRRPADGKNPI
ncbi:MAG TPA: helix-turn-helix transcriptional regulator [Devosiaceae bacterium]|nr:helix-turn-helix transcriptional regulator [Devosiaceae bacterium]